MKSIEVPNAGDIGSACILNRNMILTGDDSKIIRQWKIEGDSLILISKKENAHDNYIGALLNMKMVLLLQVVTILLKYGKI